MAEKTVVLPLDEILDGWLKENGVTLDWVKEELIKYKDRVEIRLHFHTSDVYGDFTEVGLFLYQYGEDSDE